MNDGRTELISQAVFTPPDGVPVLFAGVRFETLLVFNRAIGCGPGTLFSPAFCIDKNFPQPVKFPVVGNPCSRTL